MSTLKDKTAKGLLWGAVNSGSMQVLNALIGIVLGRLLSATDYGLVGMIAVFTAIAGCLQDSGFSTALVNVKNIAHKHYNAVFWFSVGMGSTLYVILFLAAPLIAQFFHEPLLVDVSRVTFLSIPLSALGIVPSAYMLRNLMNKEKALLSITALVVSGSVGVSCALMGLRHWSIVAQQLVYIAITGLGKYIFVKWHPTLAVDFSPIKEMFAFSNKLLITSLVNTLNQNLLTFFFGWAFNAATVGIYNQAYKWNNMASQLVTGMVSQVAQPVLTSLNDERERQLRAFRKMLRFTAFTSFPAMLGLAMIARDFIVLTITAKWLDSALLLQLLCLGGAFLPFHTLYQNLLFSTGRSERYMNSTLLMIALQLLCIIATFHMGITAMVTACALLNVAWVGVWNRYAQPLIGISKRMVLTDILPYFVIAGVVMTAVYFATEPIYLLPLRLTLRILIGAISYIAAMRILQPEMLLETIHYLFKKKT